MHASTNNRNTAGALQFIHGRNTSIRDAAKTLCAEGKQNARFIMVYPSGKTEWIHNGDRVTVHKQWN